MPLNAPQPGAGAHDRIDVAEYATWNANQIGRWLAQIGCPQTASLLFPVAGTIAAISIVSGTQLKLLNADVLDQIMPHDEDGKLGVALGFEKNTLLQALATL